MRQINTSAMAVMLILFTTSASGQTSFAYADVVASVPIYQVVQVAIPQRQCWDEEIMIDRYSHENANKTPLLVSTIIGGAIGNAVGHNKSNQRVGAILGAMLGHSIGRDIVRNESQRGDIEYNTVQRCSTFHEQREEERLVGYQVTYLYNGQEYSIRTDYDPGDRVQIRISVQPVL